MGTLQSIVMGLLFFIIYLNDLDNIPDLLEFA